MSTATLYSISEHLLALLDSLDMCETDEQRAECEADIRRVVEAQVRKVDNFARFLTHLESQADLAAQEIERLKSRQAAFVKTAERLERYAIQVMESLQVRRLEGETARLALRTNRPAVVIDDDALVPSIYKNIRQEVHIDKRLIKGAIDSGNQVPGAHLAPPSVSLIRT